MFGPVQTQVGWKTTLAKSAPDEIRKKAIFHTVALIVFHKNFVQPLSALIVRFSKFKGVYEGA